MLFYNRRQAHIARKRREAGYPGRRNSGWRELGHGFVPGSRVARSLLRGVRCWVDAEIHALMLRPVPAAKKSAAMDPQPAAAL